MQHPSPTTKRITSTRRLRPIRWRLTRRVRPRRIGRCRNGGSLDEHAHGHLGVNCRFSHSVTSPGAGDLWLIRQSQCDFNPICLSLTNRFKSSTGRSRGDSTSQAQAPTPNRRSRLGDGGGPPLPAPGAGALTQICASTPQRGSRHGRLGEQAVCGPAAHGPPARSFGDGEFIVN